MIMSFLFFITVYFSPANYLEKLIISIFTMKAGTWEKWENLYGGLFQGLSGQDCQIY